MCEAAWWFAGISLILTICWIGTMWSWFRDINRLREEKATIVARKRPIWKSIGYFSGFQDGESYAIRYKLNELRRDMDAQT